MEEHTGRGANEDSGSLPLLSAELLHAQVCLCCMTGGLCQEKKRAEDSTRKINAVEAIIDAANGVAAGGGSLSPALTRLTNELLLIAGLDSTALPVELRGPTELSVNDPDPTFPERYTQAYWRLFDEIHATPTQDLIASELGFDRVTLWRRRTFYKVSKVPRKLPP